MKLSICIISVLLTMLVLALGQTDDSLGGLRGRVIDADFGGTIPEASIELLDVDKKVVSDADGTFSILGIPPGTYSIRATREGYSSFTQGNVVILPNSIRELDISMTGEVAELDEVISAPEEETQTETLLDLRLEVGGLVEALGEDFLSKAGAGDVGQALKKLVGTSTVDSRYLVVRGLADRYNTVLLNRLRVPTSDPDRRAVNVDLFPSDIVSAVTLSKTFTPELPGEFGGSSVNVISKALPDEPFIKAKFKTEFNTQATGNNRWVTYSGAGTKIFGTATERRIPPILKFNVGGLGTPGGIPPVMGVRRETAPIGWEVSTDLGTKLDFFGRPLGIVGAFAYSRSFDYDGKALLGRAEGSVVTRTGTNQSGSEKLGITTLVGAGYQFNENNEVGVTLFLNRVAEDRAVFQRYQDLVGLTEKEILHYTERDLFTVQATGRHIFPELNEMETTWGFAASKTSQKEPDIRKFTSFVFPLPTFTVYLIGGDPIGTGISRTWRNVEDTGYNVRMDNTLPLFEDGEKEAKISFGANFEKTVRSYRENLFVYTPEVTTFIGFGDKTWAQSFFTPAGGGLISPLGLFIAPQIYTADQNLLAGYLNTEFDLTENLTVFLGARAESTDIRVNGVPNQTYIPGYNDNIFTDPVTGAVLTKPIVKANINQVDLLPAIGATWEFYKDMRLRANWSKTIARPSLKELGPIAILDAVSDELFQGTPQLQLSSLDNYDVRIEWTPGGGDILAAGLFAKEIYNAIERVQLGGSTFRFLNTPRGTVYGAELEFQKDLSYLEILNNFTFSGNLAIMRSAVSLTGPRLGQKIKEGITTRRLQAQPDYTLNLNLIYDNDEVGLSYGILYNVTGPLLYSTSGVTAVEDIFQAPFASLDAFIKKSFFDDRFAVSFRASNILNSKSERYYDSPRRELYSKEGDGVTYSISIEGRW